MKKAEKFCSSCGRYIEENDKPADPAKRKKIISVIMAVVAVVFIVGVFGISFSPQSNQVPARLLVKSKK